MEEKKRLTATKAAITKFREEHPSFTDEHLASLVESTYPKLYEDNLEVAIEIVKELYRRQEPWTDDSFVALLKEVTEAGKYHKYELEIREIKRNYQRCDILFDKIYREAKEKSFLLSQCPEYDKAMKDFIIKMYGREDLTFAQIIYNILNRKAKEDINPNGYNDLYLQFHCYPEKNDDVLFTQEDKGLTDYDESGMAEEMKRFRQISKSRILIDRIYEDARSKTMFLSQYPEYQDKEVKEYFVEICANNGRTLAQQLFALLNQKALDDAGELSGFILPFHCYSEPNGDVVFTKNKRTKDDYDENGHPLISEEVVINRTNVVNDTSNKGGCLGVVVISIVLTSLIAFL